MADNNIHAGHRRRMLDKFSEKGIDVFCEHEKLEVLLYLIIPRKNTNPIAHNLINKFGSLKNLLSAPSDELQKIDGIGKNAALQLRFFGAVINYLKKTRVSVRDNFSSANRVTEYCRNHFNGKIGEAFTLLLLDEKYALLHVHDLTCDMSNHLEAACREIVGQIMMYDSRKVVIAHKLATVAPNPSERDLKHTRRISEILKVIDVGLVDHIIISNDGAISLRNYGVLNGIWEN